MNGGRTEEKIILQRRRERGRGVAGKRAKKVAE